MTIYGNPQTVPTPESRTSTTAPALSCAETIIKWRGRSFTALIASIALTIRLRSTCCSWTRSPTWLVETTTGLSGGEWRTALFFVAAAAAMLVLNEEFHATSFSIPLEIGRTYTFNRYWKNDGNPVTIKVLRREKVKVPAGEFEEAENHYLRAIDLGFATNVVLIEVMPGDARIPPDRRAQYLGAAIARAAAVPGVEAASAAHVFPLDFGGALVDTPGMREFGLWDIGPDELASLFPEMADQVGHCKFGLSCRHDREPGCAIRQAVMAGTVSPYRYQSYMKLREEL